VGAASLSEGAGAGEHAHWPLPVKLPHALPEEGVAPSVALLPQAPSHQGLIPLPGLSSKAGYVNVVRTPCPLHAHTHTKHLMVSEPCDQHYTSWLPPIRSWRSAGRAGELAGHHELVRGAWQVQRGGAAHRSAAVGTRPRSLLGRACGGAGKHAPDLAGRCIPRHSQSPPLQYAK
jgi:hypothetical protein